MASVVQMHVKGLSERELATELEIEARRLGSAALPFDFIVAGGPRGAMPHAEPSDDVPGEGLLVVDMGTTVGGYASDMTRTFALGPPKDREAEIYEVVRLAQQRAMEGARPGVPCAEVDDLARSAIIDEGYGEYFQHSLGHGVGLEVHEGPRLSGMSDEVLEEGMVVTIEPGIYVPGLGGVRVEDTVLIAAGGAQPLTSFDRSLVMLT
jgi:Xaa-Pro aminopeptidase